MARLGEAYVRVRADLKDFDADLERALKASTAKFEKSLNAGLGKKVGKDVAAGVTSELDTALKKSTEKFSDDFEKASKGAGKRGGKGLKEGFQSSAGGGFLEGFFKSIGGAITDGLSGLPPQVRTALGVGVILAAPVILTGVGAAVSAGIALGVTGLGAALASQYEEVRAGARTLMESVREGLVTAAEPFVAPLLEAFGRIDAFFEDLQGRLNNIFGKASGFIQPLTSGVLGFLDLATAGIENFTENADGYIDAISDGMIFLGSAVEQVLTEFGELGEDGETALRDLLFAIADITVFTGKLIVASTELYNVFRNVATGTRWWNDVLRLLSPLLNVSGVAFKNIEEATKAADKALEGYDRTTDKFIDSEGRSIRVTDAQTKALKEQADALQDLRDAQLGTIDSLVSYHQSVRNLAKTAKENKGAFGFDSEKGLETISAYSRALKDAEKSAQEAFQAGKVNEEQAQELYRQRAYGARRAAIEAGVQKSAIDAIFGAISDVIALPPIPDKFAQVASSAASAIAWVQQFNTELNRARFTPGVTVPPPSAGVSSNPPSSPPNSYRGYANGTFSTREQLAWISEGNTPEVVLPLNNPRRTRELASESGLMNILGGDGAMTVLVYVGNEQLDSRMYRVARANERAQARMMSSAPRMI
jgi:hypothetical protein